MLIDGPGVSVVVAFEGVSAVSGGRRLVIPYTISFGTYINVYCYLSTSFLSIFTGPQASDLRLQIYKSHRGAS